MTDPTIDELFDLRNAFYTGNYQGCIKEAQKMRPTDTDIALEKDIFLYRSYIALRKFGIVRDEINDNSPDRIRPLKSLAKYIQDPSSRASIVAEMEQEVSGTVDPNNFTLLYVAATIFCKEQNYEAALRVLYPSNELESISIRIQVLIAMDRIDLARKELKTLTEKDDDATITQLATAWVNLQMGGDKLQDAYYIYQELIDKFGATPLLLNGQASSFLQQDKFEEAEAALSESLEKDPSNAESLINMISLSLRTGKPQEVCNRYLTQLKDENPSHPFVVVYKKKEEDMDRITKQYEI